MGSVSERHGEQTHCAECGDSAEGELFLYPTEAGVAGARTAAVCAECFSNKEDDKERIITTRWPSSAPAESPDEKFEALFKAARVLLRAKIRDEDKIIPTLRLAHTRGWRAPRMQYDSVRVVEVVERVPILERVGVTARSSRSLITDALTHFAITLWPRAEKVAAKEIANEYEKALKAEKVEWGKAGGRITYDLNKLRGYHVLLTVERSLFSKMRKEEGWPSPSLVDKVAQAALGEFSERLVIRRAGPQIGAENLILAMAAYLVKDPLSADMKVAGAGEIHRLLNEYVLCEIPWKGKIPETNYANNPLAKQLWQNVKKIEQAEDRVPDPGPYEIK